MMLQNSFVSLNDKIKDGSASFGDYLSFATTLLFGLG
jgi:hypothetical protein